MISCHSPVVESATSGTPVGDEPYDIPIVDILTLRDDAAMSIDAENGAAARVNGAGGGRFVGRACVERGDENDERRCQAEKTHHNP